MAVEFVKENVPARGPLPWWSLPLSLFAAAAAFGVATLVDRALPTPLTRQNAPSDRFIAEIAYEHLVNLTKIGPRVAGSYENEVLAVGAAVSMARAVAKAASPHNVVEVDRQLASGAFSLSFFDGMNNVYRDVQNVVVRARAAGGRPTSRRTALLLNCHLDSVPDSPGASDDAAGCAVGLETLRALAAGGPLRHDVLLLLNGAEENIMQASHAFITQHKWAGSVRAFINVEACGAGGREVLFQAGPHDPWIVEVYARAVPHPFATSMAQEMFESGLIPADTDFRIFRDFGKLSGVDLAWSSDGYVYHTALDTAQRVPPAALQRTGDNVLALAKGLAGSEQLERAAEAESGQPVFFDVLGQAVVVARAPAAVLAALAALGLLALRLHLNARQGHRELYIGKRGWYGLVGREALRLAFAGCAGVGAAAAIGLCLHIAGARLAYYARPALVVPLFVAPAAGVALLVLTPPGQTAAWRRGWWGARVTCDALGVLAGGLVALALLLRLRSGYVGWLWLLLGCVHDLAAQSLGGRRLAWWALGWALPALQSCYVARDSLAMLIPLCGRAGKPPLPLDMVIGAAVAGIALTAAHWVAVVAQAARNTRRMAWALCVTGVVTALVAASGVAGGPYSAQRPQRLMMFHVRQTQHERGLHSQPTTGNYYWVPELDPNTAATLDALPAEYGPRDSQSQCDKWVYCGAPYFLPVLSFVPVAHRLPAPPPSDVATLDLNITTREIQPGLHELKLRIIGPSHVVVIVSPVPGGVVERTEGLGELDAPGALREAAPWGDRKTYFITLHAASRPRDTPRLLTFIIRVPIREGGSGDTFSETVGQVSVAGHAMSGARSDHHNTLLATPQHVAPTGWPVDLHLYRI